MFLEVSDPGQGIAILGQWVPRARLGLHLRLSQVSTWVQQALDAGDAIKASGHIRAYFSLCGFDAAELTGPEQMGVYVLIAHMNRLQFVLPFQEGFEEGLTDPVPYDYPGRTWAWWIHKLASRYGWTRDEVFDLYPEEAAAYLQEIIVSEYHEMEDRRALSELAYKYDTTTRTATFRPIPKPGWMVDKPGDEDRTDGVVKIRKALVPIGNVVNLDELYQADPEQFH